MKPNRFPNETQLLKNLSVPTGPVDVVLDTDAYNEIDDQYALAYLLRSSDRLHVKGICAAPFFNQNSSSPADGMEKSFEEIRHLLFLAGCPELEPVVFRGSDRYLPDEQTPVPSDAASFLAGLSESYTPEHPLYVVAIGAITNVASALLLNPEIKNRIVVVWLGGHALYMNHTQEFNMAQDVAAARVVFGCGVPLIQLPCLGVVDVFSTSRYELEHWLKGKNSLCDYLVEHTVREAERYAAGKPWTRVIWDVTAVAWLLNDSDRFMQSCLIPSPIPEYDHHYGQDPTRHLIRSVYRIHRDALFEDLFRKLTLPCPPSSLS